MNDLISRQAAIEAINQICPIDTEYDCTLLDRVDVRCVLMDLPPAQPELIAQGAYVRGFEQGRTQGMIDTKLQQTCNQLATDTISRQAAIDAIYKCTDIFINNLPVMVDKADAYKALAELPSAQPDIEKICTRIKAETIKRNVEYMKHGDRYMLGFVDGMRLARRIVDGTIDDPVYFTRSGE